MNEMREYLDNWKKLGNYIDGFCSDKESNDADVRMHYLTENLAKMIHEVYLDEGVLAKFVAKEAIVRANKLVKKYKDTDFLFDDMIPNNLAYVYVASMKNCRADISTEDACDVLKNVVALSQEVRNPEILLLKTVSRLDDEKVVDTFLAGERGILFNNLEYRGGEILGAKRSISYESDMLFDACTNIVKSYPEKAKICNEIVGYALNCLPDGYDFDKNIDEYYKTVCKTNGVSEDDKIVAKNAVKAKRNTINPESGYDNTNNHPTYSRHSFLLRWKDIR